MNKQSLSQFDPQIKHAITNELKRQEEGLEMIPSENFVSLAVLEALGSVFTNKYAEGFPGRRYYGGNEFTDIIETLAIERAKKLFRCDHANVQPLSGSPMNQAVYLAFCKPGDTIMGMDLSHGGHLTHARLSATWANCLILCATKHTRKIRAGLILMNCQKSPKRQNLKSCFADIQAIHAIMIILISSAWLTRSRYNNGRRGAHWRFNCRTRCAIHLIMVLILLLPPRTRHCAGLEEV